MATKQDLEKRIAELEQQMQDKQRALRLLSEDNGCIVKVPEHTYTFTHINAPLAGMREDGKNNVDSWQARVMLVIATAIREHGVCIKEAHFFTTHSSTTLDLGSEGMGSNFGVPYVVPRLVGLFLRELLNGCAEFGQDCVAEGYEAGADLLARLQRNEITVDEFDGSLEQATAVRRQEFKRLRFDGDKRAPGTGPRAKS